MDGGNAEFEYCDCGGGVCIIVGCFGFLGIS